MYRIKEIENLKLTSSEIVIYVTMFGRFRVGSRCFRPKRIRGWNVETKSEIRPILAT